MTFGNKKNTIINNFRIKNNNNNNKNNKSDFVDLRVGKINVRKINFSERKKEKKNLLVLFEAVTLRNIDLSPQ